MAYKGLSERFDKRASELYGKYSIPTSEYSAYAYEIKPHDPDKNALSHDTRFSPGRTALRDYIRIASFVKSDRGILFMLRQAELQAGNTFSETRLYNPLFPFGRIQPNFVRIRRSLTTARDADVGNAGSRGFASAVLGSPTEKSPGSDSMVRGAGRLQKASAKSAINSALKRSGPTGLMSLIPPNKITRVVSSVQNILEVGTLGVNERPETNVDGQLYSVVQWLGFNTRVTGREGLAAAANAVRKGDIKGAFVKLLKGATSSVKQRLFGVTTNKVNTSPREGRDSAINSTINGYRYFIVNNTDADRYLQNSVVNGVTTMEYLDRLPYQLEGKSLLFDNYFINTPQLKQRSNAITSSLKNIIASSKKKNAITKIGNILKKTASAILGNRLNAIAAGTISVGPTNTKSRLTRQTNSINTVATNPAEQHMLFGTLSLASRYADASGHVKQFIEGLKEQRQTWFDSITRLQTDVGYNHSYNHGIQGGFSAGSPVMDDHGIISNRRLKNNTGRYYIDSMADKDAIWDNTSATATEVSTEVKQDIRRVYRDVIDFMFHDYVNNKVVPFRAVLDGITETVTPGIESQPYIGRPEKYVVYTGASRKLQFTMTVYATSADNIDFIWKKINYLTGLCFPATYSNGYMVPPLVQLTIGKLYVDQPGYIESLTHTIENSSWDINPDVQVPMIITIAVSFGILEKSQPKVKSSFYGFGNFEN